MHDRNRLTWRCRRGTRELDILVQYYLRHHYDDAPAHLQRAFESMLDMSDPELYDLLNGHLETAHKDISLVVQVIRNKSTS